MFVLPKKAEAAIFKLYLINSMQLIFMPFSDMLAIIMVHYTDSLSLTLCIKVASVLSLMPNIVTIYVFKIFELVCDGLKFRLKQPLKLFDISNTQNCIRKHLEAVVNLYHSLKFSLHDYLKTLMCRS